MLTLVSLSAYMAIAAAVVFIGALFSHVRWWYRHAFDSLAEAFAVSDSPRGRLGMIDLVTGLALFGLLGVPQALYTVFPGSITPAVLILTGGAMIGLFGLGALLVIRGYALAYIGARSRAAAGFTSGTAKWAVEASEDAVQASEDAVQKGSDSADSESRDVSLHPQTQEHEHWLRLGEFVRSGPLGEGPSGIFQVLISLWVFRVGLAMTGEVPVLGFAALLVGLWGSVGGLLGMWRGLARPDQGQVPLRGIAGSLALTILWFAGMSVWLLL